MITRSAGGEPRNGFMHTTPSVDIVLIVSRFGRCAINLTESVSCWSCSPYDDMVQITVNRTKVKKYITANRTFSQIVYTFVQFVII